MTYGAPERHTRSSSLEHAAHGLTQTNTSFIPEFARASSHLSLLTAVLTAVRKVALLYNAPLLHG